METQLHILQDTVEVLAEAAKFFVTSNTAYAIRSRWKANKSTPGKPGKRAFHPAILSSLTALLSRLRDNTKLVDSANLQFSQAVEAALYTFERLVGDVDRTNSYPASYHGLRELKVQYDADASEKRKPKPPGFRRHLYCPSPDFQAELKDTIELCYEAFILATTPSERLDDTTSILAETKTVQEWHVPAALTTHPETLHSILSRFESCGSSPERDDIRVAFSTGERISEALVTYQIRLSCPAQIAASWRPAILHLLPPEEASSAKHIAESKPRRRAVRFQDNESSGDNNRQVLTSLCEASRYTDACPQIFATIAELKSQMSQTSEIQSIRHLAPVQMISLRTALDSQSFSQVRPRERIILRVIVAYLYLCLGDTLWWDFKPDFWFVHNNLAGVRQPFLRFRSDTTTAPRPSHPEKGMNAERPSLPSLGKLLLEIWRGSSVTWENLPAVLEECRTDVTGEYWLCAINACLGESADLKHPGKFRQSQVLRSTYVHRVIKSLQWLLEKVCRETVDDIFRDLTFVGASMQQQNTPTQKSGG